MTRRIAIAGAGAAIAAGTVLAGAGPAPAAPARTAGHLAVQGAAADGVSGRHHSARRPPDPWIADQLAAFRPPAARRPAVSDPWVRDQLALFLPGASVRAPA